MSKKPNMADGEAGLDSLVAFVDPRSRPSPQAKKPRQRPAGDPDELAALHRLCKEGRLYEIEEWIRSGRPLQVEPDLPRKERPRDSALEIALDRGDQALALLLLCNGYDPDDEEYSPLDLALRARRLDLVDLLLEWGADPHRVDLEDLFGTYRSKLFDRFRRLGVDLTAGHGIARTLAYHTSNKPLFGFAKRLRRREPKVQAELDAALVYHARRGNEKGVSLCLWAGADPHAPACDIHYCDCAEEDDSDEGRSFRGFSAIYRACLSGQVEVLEKLEPDPDRDDFAALFRTAGSGAVIEFLAGIAPPKEINLLVQDFVFRLTWPPDQWRSLSRLERLFKVGGRWHAGSKEVIASVRGTLLRVSEETFVEVVKLFTKDDYCSDEVLIELGRTPAFRSRLKATGFIPSTDGGSGRWRDRRPRGSRRILSRFGIELPKPPPPPLPRVFEIGHRGKNRRQIKLDRPALFDRAWTVPMVRLSEEWGLSDRGLAKAYARLRIPLPPRGYWAKLSAGKRVRRAKLPDLDPGEAEEIIIWAPVDERQKA